MSPANEASSAFNRARSASAPSAPRLSPASGRDVLGDGRLRDVDGGVGASIAALTTFSGTFSEPSPEERSPEPSPSEWSDRHRRRLPSPASRVSGRPSHRRRVVQFGLALLRLVLRPRRETGSRVEHVPVVPIRVVVAEGLAQLRAVVAAASTTSAASVGRIPGRRGRRIEPRARRRHRRRRRPVVTGPTSAGVTPRGESPPGATSVAQLVRRAPRDAGGRRSIFPLDRRPRGARPRVRRGSRATGPPCGGGGGSRLDAAGGDAAVVGDPAESSRTRASAGCRRVRVGRTGARGTLAGSNREAPRV